MLARQDENVILHERHGCYLQAASVEDFCRNLAVVQQRIASVCQQGGRDPTSLRLLPISTTF